MKIITNKDIGKKIREHRLLKGFSQSELGKHLGITYQQIQKYEKGSNSISVKCFLMVCSFLEISIYEFLGEEIERNLKEIELKNKLLKFIEEIKQDYNL
jgi:transcriptional regulator with XRE-family HTH domain